jgi:hypothetical protein
MKSGVILKAVVALGFFGSIYSGQHRIFIAQAQAPSSTNDATASLQEQIVAKEREGLDALKTGNLDIFGKLTADEAVMVDAQGPATKTQVLLNVGEFKLTDYSIEDLKFLTVSATTGLISYKITEKKRRFPRPRVYGQSLCVFSLDKESRGMGVPLQPRDSYEIA